MKTVRLIKSFRYIEIRVSEGKIKVIHNPFDVSVSFFEGDQFDKEELESWCNRNEWEMFGAEKIGV